jgi:hypothetical protein
MKTATAGVLIGRLACRGSPRTGQDALIYFKPYGSSFYDHLFIRMVEMEPTNVTVARLHQQHC